MPFLLTAIRYIIITVGIVSVAVRSLDWPPDWTDRTSGVPWAFLVLLLSGIGMALLLYRVPHARAAKTLEGAARELEKKRLAVDEPHTPAREPDPQVREADAASGNADQRVPRRPKAFKNWQPLRDAWKGFHDARRGNSHGPASSTSAASPADHFTVASVLGRDPGSLPNALPSVFTAVGLLGTFVGIALGLAEIEPTAATEDLMEGIRTLMGGMSTAFLTSIVGITCSVWWLFEFRFAERKLKSGLERFIVVTERVFPVEEPHETLMRVAAANESVRRTAETIGKTAEEIKGNVQSLGQDLADALEPYFEEHIAKPIRHLNTELGDRQTEALRSMVAAFQDTLVSSVKQELSEFGKALRDASDHQTNAARELAGFFERLRQVSETQIGLLDRTMEAATVFDRGLAGLAAATEAIETAGESARETMTAARDAMNIVRGLAEESRRQLEAQEEVSKAARRSWDAQASLLDDMRASIDRLATDLGDRIVEFRTASAQKITEVFTVFDSEMAKVVDHLSGTLAELRDATDELPSAVGSLRETTQELADAGRAQRDSLAKGLRAFEEVRAKLAGKLEQTRDELRDMGRALPVFVKDIGVRQSDFAKAADSVQRGIAAVADGMAKTGARSDQNTQRLVDSMATAAGSIHEVAGSVAASVAPVERRTAEAAKRMAALSESIEALAGALDRQREADGRARREAVATRAATVDETLQSADTRSGINRNDGETVLAGRTRPSGQATHGRATAPRDGPASSPEVAPHAGLRSGGPPDSGGPPASGTRSRQAAPLTPTQPRATSPFSGPVEPAGDDAQGAGGEGHRRRGLFRRLFGSRR